MKGACRSRGEQMKDTALIGPLEAMPRDTAHLLTADAAR